MKLLVSASICKFLIAGTSYQLPRSLFIVLPEHFLLELIIHCTVILICHHKCIQFDIFTMLVCVIMISMGCNLSIYVCIKNIYIFTYVYQLSGCHSTNSVQFGITWPCVSCPKMLILLFNNDIIMFYVQLLYKITEISSFCESTQKWLHQCGGSRGDGTISNHFM